MLDAGCLILDVKAFMDKKCCLDGVRKKTTTQSAIKSYFTGEHPASSIKHQFVPG
jgi:hypothetical protein